MKEYEINEETMAIIPLGYYQTLVKEVNNEYIVDKKAYEKGFIGMPGFKTDEIYRSDELFAFFKNNAPGIAPKITNNANGKHTLHLIDFRSFQAKIIFVG